MKRLFVAVLALAAAWFIWVTPLIAQSAQPPIGTQLTALFNGTQSITKAFSAVSGKSIYITQISVSGPATGVFTLSKGTGTNCGTGTTTLFTETKASGIAISQGDGAGVIAVVGSGVDLCITVGTNSLTGWVSIAQF